MKANITQIIARTLFDCGVAPLTWTPALGVTEIMDEYNGISVVPCPYSFNEESAYSIAHGGALYGGFSASIIKTHGLLKAANAVSDSMFVELSGAMVVVVIDDRDGIRSDSIIFAEKILTGLEMPFIVSSADTVYSDILKSFEKSRSMCLPVAIIIDTAEVLNKELEYIGDAPTKFQKLPFHRCPERKILFPTLTRYQRKVLDSRLAGEEIPEKPSMPMIPDDIPPYWHPAIKRYTPMMNALKSQKTEKTFISTDIGFYASFSFPPFEIQDVCTFMGCAISLAAGAVQAGCEDAWAVVGDFTFIAAGHLVLLDPGILELPVKVILIDNGMAETTGRQIIPRDSLTRALELVSGHVTHVNEPFDENVCRNVLKKAGTSKEALQVVVFHFPLENN
jgi:TPP-dependent indolepyruvate ferredoxin oxidoreductase alpha subunit